MKLTPSSSDSTSSSSSNPKPRGPLDHEVRHQIIEAAHEYFGHYGFDKTTVSDLAKAIGFSKAYIYKFFDSKQAIGEQICADRLIEITNKVNQVIAGETSAAERLSLLFHTVVSAGCYLFFHDQKLYEIAATSAQDEWEPALAYESRIKSLVLDILREGRASGEFEQKSTLSETAETLYLVMQPYVNPLMLQYNLQNVTQSTELLCGLMLRSLQP